MYSFHEAKHSISPFIPEVNAAVSLKYKEEFMPDSVHEEDWLRISSRVWKNLESSAGLQCVGWQAHQNKEAYQLWLFLWWSNIQQLRTVTETRPTFWLAMTYFHWDLGWWNHAQEEIWAMMSAYSSTEYRVNVKLWRVFWHSCHEISDSAWNYTTSTTNSRFYRLEYVVNCRVFVIYLPLGIVFIIIFISPISTQHEFSYCLFWHICAGYFCRNSPFFRCK